MWFSSYIGVSYTTLSIRNFPISTHAPFLLISFTLVLDHLWVWWLDLEHRSWGLYSIRQGYRQSRVPRQKSRWARQDQTQKEKLVGSRGAWHEQEVWHDEPLGAANVEYNTWGLLNTPFPLVSFASFAHVSLT